MRSNAPVIGGGNVVQGRTNPLFPQQPQQQQSPIEMAQQYQMLQEMFGGGGAASQAPGLQASGATTAGIGSGGTGVGAAAGSVVGTPIAGGAAPVAGAATTSLALPAALIGFNEWAQNEMGNRGGFEDYAKSFFSGGTTDKLKYMETAGNFVNDEALKPIGDFFTDNINLDFLKIF